MITRSVMPVGALETNCYLVFVEEKKRLYVIDPGGDAGELTAAANAFAFTSAAILLTHAHFDHIGALEAMKRAIQPDCIYLNAADVPLYRSPENCMLPYCPAVQNLPAVQTSIDPQGDFVILPLPGHSLGGSGFYFKEISAVFVGDTIFSGSVGRTDFPGGDYKTLVNSIRTQLFSLPDDTILLPGHGSPTSVGREKTTNPYVQG